MADTEELTYTFGQEEDLALSAGQKHTIIIKRIISKTILEIEDVLFNLNSAVMMPDVPDSTSSDQGSFDKKGLGISFLQGKTTGLHVVRAI